MQRRLLVALLLLSCLFAQAPRISPAASTYPVQIIATAPVAEGGCGIVMSASDQTSALNTCLGAAASANPNGFVIQFPPGTVGMCDLPLTQTGATLRGASGLGISTGSALAIGGATIFKSTCSSGTHAIVHATSCRGCAVQQVAMDANSTAVRNLWTTDINSGLWSDLNLANSTADAAWYWDSASLPGWCNGGGGIYRNINIVAVGGHTTGVIFSGQGNFNQDTCSQDWQHLNILAGGFLDAHGIYFRVADSNRMSFLETAQFGPTVTAITVGSGSCGGTFLSASQACITTLQAHGLGAAAVSGVFLAKGTGNGGTPGLFGDFVATGVNATQVILTLPNPVASGTYCASQGACGTTILGSGVMFGNAWDNSIDQYVGAGMNWVNPDNPTPPNRNANLGNTVTNYQWPELCAGDFDCARGIGATGIYVTGSDGSVWNQIIRNRVVLNPGFTPGAFTSVLDFSGITGSGYYPIMLPTNTFIGATGAGLGFGQTALIGTDSSNNVVVGNNFGSMANLNLQTTSGNHLQINGANGFTGTKVAGSCTFTIAHGIITNVTGC